MDIVGKVSAPATITVTQTAQVVFDPDQVPTAIRLRRRRDTVDILAGKPAQTYSANGTLLPYPFRGFNVYASRDAGGTSGYHRVNAQLIDNTSSVYEEDTLPVGEDTVTWLNTNLKNVRLRLTEEDEFGQTLATRLDRTYDISFLRDRVRFASTIEGVTLLEFGSFRHSRTGSSTTTLNNDQWVDVPDESPLYYVVTGVYYDPTTQTEVESPFSQEVLGAPLILDTTVRDLPGRVAQQIRTAYINAVLRVNGEISLIPGSTTFDVSINPFASEASRIWQILDFVHRSQSFLTLLQSDDANGDGISDDPATSDYKIGLKSALGLSSDTAVQALINQQFDKLAANVSKPRLAGRPSQGQVVFYTSTRPTIDLIVPAGTIVTTTADASLGIPSVRFRVGGSFILPAAGADAFYNIDTQRYEIIADVVAESSGLDGNRPAGQLTNAAAVPGLSVTNTEATVFGDDRESNADLATRCILAISSVDTGTTGGYQSTVIGQTAVLKAKVVQSGDPLMMRDYDVIRQKHAGGKVDVWVQGLRERQVAERFAFSFDVARDIPCTLIDLATLTFRVNDSRVTPQTPVVEMLNNLAQGLGVRNVSLGQDYDLTGVQILDYQTFRLNAGLITQPVTHVDDVVTADYRYRSVNRFFFTFQPVRRVVSVVGEVAGALTPTTGYTLYKTDDPLLEGESTIARDNLVINQVLGIPTGATVGVNDEQHVLIGTQSDPLLSIGINTQTIRVFNLARTVEYDGPDTAAPDFSITPGLPTKPARIVRTTASTIKDGETVSVDYSHDENFTVTYVVNDLLQQLQLLLNTKRHTTADVLVKQAIDNALDLEATAQLKRGATKDKVDPIVRTAVSIELNDKLIGQGSAQSDIIRSIDASTGIDYLIVPLAKMAYADGSRRLRESVVSDYVRLSSLDQGANLVYLLTSPLRAPTTDGGGEATEHKGVFQDDQGMTMSASLAQVGLVSSGFIIGAAGAVIAGYTDDATLLADGFLTPALLEAERLRRTANHVVVSLPGGGDPLDIPSAHTYAASYVVRGDSGARDIDGAQVEYLSLGNFTITYREATT